MNRVSSVAVVLFAGFFMAFSSNAQADSALNLNLLYGQKSMEKWQNELKELPAYGVEGDIALGSLPVNLWLGVSSGKDTGKSVSQGLAITVDTNQTEMYIGARTYLQFVPLITPYFGAGVSTVKAEISGKSSGISSSYSATTTGYLLNAGALFRIGVLQIGGDYRILSGTSFDFAGARSNANYSQIGVVVGFNF
jgi:hypothetical protein